VSGEHAALLRALRARCPSRQVWLVGGAVRDELLGRPVRDLDLVVTGDAGSLRGALGPWADSLWMQGEAHASLGVIKGGVRIEITTLGDGEILADLARRDFTVNALARDLDTDAVLDPGDGRGDIAARVLRCCGDPAARFAEDPIRLLRAVRLAVELGLSLAEETAAALRDSAVLLASAAAERVGDELEALLCSPQPAEGLAMLADLGLLVYAAPELEDLRGLPQPPRYHRLDAWEHTRACVALVPGVPVLRWAALLHDIGKAKTFSQDETGIHFARHEDLGAEMAEAMLQRWARPRALRAGVVALVRHHLLLARYQAEWTDAAVRRLVRRVGDGWEDLLALTRADQQAGRVGAEAALERLGRLAERVLALGGAVALAGPSPLLNAEEVMAALDIPPGPLVGEALRLLASEREAGRIMTADDAREALRTRFPGRRVAPTESGV